MDWLADGQSNNTIKLKNVLSYKCGKTEITEKKSFKNIEKIKEIKLYPCLILLPGDFKPLFTS